MKHQPDPKLDLLLERVVDVPRDRVWRAWTTPEEMVHWFTPAPWKTVSCTVDLRPGGMFRTVMQSPEGAEFPADGCYLEIIENEKLVWTSALKEGFRPNSPASVLADDSFFFTAVITLEPHGTGTKYSALVIHGDEATREKHEAMGFHHGWGAALDQLVAMVKQNPE